jgi:two-component system, OmpR family, response regulator
MRPRRVLLVDDDCDILFLAKLSLIKVGRWEVASAGSGEEALGILDTFLPDVIILDVMMPGMDGFMLLEQIRKRPDLAATPLIFMSANTRINDAMGESLAGVAGVIKKPFDPMSLPHEILKIIKPLRARIS